METSTARNNGSIFLIQPKFSLHLSLSCHIGSRENAAYCCLFTFKKKSSSEISIGTSEAIQRFFEIKLLSRTDGDDYRKKHAGEINLLRTRRSSWIRSHSKTQNH